MLNSNAEALYDTASVNIQLINAHMLRFKAVFELCSLMGETKCR